MRRGTGCAMSFSPAAATSCPSGRWPGRWRPGHNSAGDNTHDRAPAAPAALPYACLMTREEIEKAFADEGLSPHSWSNRANYFYEPHLHDYDKVLYCVQGEVTFHLSDGDIVLHPGQRVDIPAGARHAATVGSDGVEWMEAPKYRRG